MASPQKRSKSGSDRLNYCCHPSKRADKSPASHSLCSKHGVSNPRGYISEACEARTLLRTGPRCDRTRAARITAASPRMLTSAEAPWWHLQALTGVTSRVQRDRGVKTLEGAQ